MNIQLKCPHCGGEIQVAAAVGLEAKSAKCPLCQTTDTLGHFLPKCSFKVDNDAYQLRFGSQWVGRKKAGNDAEVQIEDSSMYMSKKHAMVELRCTAAGIECTFEEHGTNPTSVQGIELIKDDIVYLNINDCLTLGGKNMYLAQEYGNTN